MKKTLIAAVALLGLCGRALAVTTSTPVQLDHALSVSGSVYAVTHDVTVIALPAGETELSMIWSYSTNGAAQPGGAFSFTRSTNGSTLGTFRHFLPMQSGVEYTRHLQVPTGGMNLYIVDASGSAPFSNNLLATNAFIWVETRKAFGHTPANTR